MLRVSALLFFANNLESIIAVSFSSCNSFSLGKLFAVKKSMVSNSIFFKNVLKRKSTVKLTPMISKSSLILTICITVSGLTVIISLSIKVSVIKFNCTLNEPLITNKKE